MRRKRRYGLRLVLLLLAIAGIALFYAWLQREQIADDLITGWLDDYGLEAQYEIESIAPGRQVLTDMVIGDPDRPDLTIARAELRIEPRFGMPGIGRITLVEPRLYGTFIDGELSFGSLDPLIFTGEEGPFDFPDLELVLHDGRALIEGDLGPVALRLAGEGHLRGGFAGELAAVAPRLALPGCIAREATIYGAIRIRAERPDFSGPLRFEELECADAGFAVRDGGLQLTLRADRDLAGLEGDFGLRSGEVAGFGAELAAMQGEGAFAWRNAGFNAEYELQGSDLQSAAFDAAAVGIEGALRARDAFARIEVDAEIAGRNVQPGQGLAARLADASAASAGTLAQPLLDRFRRNLATEIQGSTFAASVLARREGEQLSLVIPEARLRGRSGDSLLALSRGQLGLADDGGMLFSGNVATGGDGMPRIAGRLEQSERLTLRLQMQEYAAGNSRLAIPNLLIEELGGGVFALDGQVEATGALPGGFAENLVLPVEGRLASDGSIALWPECVELRFDRLQVSNLALGRQRLTLCPPRGSPILAAGPGGLRIAAGAPSLSLQGELGGTAIRIASGPVGLAYPGAFAARELDVALGPQGSTVQFHISNLAAELGGALRGSFQDADVLLAAVPLDILGASGDWAYGEDGLILSNAGFTLEDRQEQERFNPLDARDARLVLFDNRIATAFTLRLPESGQQIAEIDLLHDLGSGTGDADLDVDAVTFTPNGLQPRDLTDRAYGVVSLVDGTVTGTGRIDWNAAGITSTGSFSSDSLDLAAAFGPVKGVSGTVVFSDLLGLTTAPGQRLSMESINPGIEVFEGEVVFSLVGGTLLQLEQARWPFLGGTLSMRPLTLNLGATEVRRYVFLIDGLQASRFIERMELNNIAATGTFDGEIPVVFDMQGNGRIEDGVLTARPPGGHLSYVGQLTYEDLSYIANFAFGMLRDLEFDEMVIGMSGSLTGELVTRVRIEGVRQGATAKTNFLTRQIADLPIRLLVNIRAPFYQLISTTRALYDPAAVRDPRGLGLLDAEGNVLRPSTDFDDVQARDEAADAAAEAADDAARNGDNPDQTDIQPPESEAVP